MIGHQLYRPPSISLLGKQVADEHQTGVWVLDGRRVTEKQWLRYWRAHRRNGPKMKRKTESEIQPGQFWAANGNPVAFVIQPHGTSRYLLARLQTEPGVKPMTARQLAKFLDTHGFEQVI